MKFLVAASCLCLALIGQIQAGSLRGLEVRVPHHVYGVPEVHQEETTPLTPPSVEYGAPPVTHEVAVPFIDSLPLVDSVVSFVSTTPKPTTPELPYLQPGLPALPAAPVIPIVVEEPVPVEKVSNEYLPPATVVPSTPAPPSVVYELPTPPTDVYGPPIVPAIKAPKPSDVYGPPIVPTVNEAKPSDVYGPPTVPTVVEPKPKVEVTIPAIPKLPELPQIPVVPEVPEVHEVHEYHEVYEVPVVHVVPEVPSTPVTPSTPSGYHYSRPTAEFKLPKPTPEVSVAHQVPVAPLVHFLPLTQLPIIPKIPVFNPVQVVTNEVQPHDVSVLLHPQIHFTPGTVSTHVVSNKPIPTQVSHEVPVAPKVDTVKPGYHYEKPTIPFPPPSVLVGQSVFAHNLTSSLSSSSFHVNKVLLPTFSGTDSVVIEAPKPTDGLTGLSISGNSAGSFNQFSVISHHLPSASAPAVPHTTYNAPGH